tara:strand:- start:654 stop:905 length:252 start_codon:yes stop_codon:yes gene_type:complete
MSFSAFERGTIMSAKRMLSLKKIPEKIIVSQVSVKNNLVEINKIRELDWNIPKFLIDEIKKNNYRVIKYQGYELIVNSNYNSY